MSRIDVKSYTLRTPTYLIHALRSLTLSTGPDEVGAASAISARLAFGEISSHISAPLVGSLPAGDGGSRSGDGSLDSWRQIKPETLADWADSRGDDGAGGGMSATEKAERANRLCLMCQSRGI